MTLIEGFKTNPDSFWSCTDDPDVALNVDVCDTHIVVMDDYMERAFNKWAIEDAPSTDDIDKGEFFAYACYDIGDGKKLALVFDGCFWWMDGSVEEWALSNGLDYQFIVDCPIIDDLPEFNTGAGRSHPYILEKLYEIQKGK